MKYTDNYFNLIKSSYSHVDNHFPTVQYMSHNTEYCANSSIIMNVNVRRYVIPIISVQFVLRKDNPAIPEPFLERPATGTPITDYYYCGLFFVKLTPSQGEHTNIKVIIHLFHYKASELLGPGF